MSKVVSATPLNGEYIRFENGQEYYRYAANQWVWLFDGPVGVSEIKVTSIPEVYYLEKEYNDFKQGLEK